MYFAEEGHDVTAVDIMPHYIELLENKIKKNKTSINIKAAIGDARDLSRFPAQVFDIVLCLGPLYHLKNADDRYKCLSEACRVLKPEGIIAIAYVNRFASIVANLRSENLKRGIVDSVIENGIDPLNPFYFSHPFEIEEIAQSINCKKIHNLGTNGISYILKDKVNNLSNDDFENWIYFHLKFQIPDLFHSLNLVFYIPMRQYRS